MVQATLNPSDASRWEKFVADYDRVSASFATNFANLQKLGAYVRAKHPERVAGYNALVARGAQLQATLATLRNVRTSVVDWLTTTGRNFGIGANAIGNAASDAWNWLRQTTGLGAVPIIVGVAGVAAAAAVVAAASKWIVDCVREMNALNAMYRLEQSGATPEQAAQSVRSVLGATAENGGSFLGLPWKWIIIGGIVIVVAPPVLKMISERRK